MKVRLLHLCVAAALTLGGWGGALAAALCAHAGASHDCCPQHADERHDAQAHTGHDKHAPSATREGSCGDGHEATGDEGVGHAERGAHADGEDAAASSTRDGGFCAHCVGRSENAPPRESPTSRQSGHGHEGCVESARHAVVTGAQSFDASLTPQRGSPPGDAARRHLLLSVFRI